VTLAYALPCQRFANTLTGKRKHLQFGYKASIGRSPFILNAENDHPHYEGLYLKLHFEGNLAMS
jgi:hypothetical protein